MILGLKILCDLRRSSMAERRSTEGLPTYHRMDLCTLSKLWPRFIIASTALPPLSICNHRSYCREFIS